MTRSRETSRARGRVAAVAVVGFDAARGDVTKISDKHIKRRRGAVHLVKTRSSESASTPCAFYRDVTNFILHSYTSFVTTAAAAAASTSVTHKGGTRP